MSGCSHAHGSHAHFNPHPEPNDTRNIRIAFFLNLGFTVLEIVGGLWTNSLAILSDALHDVGDSFSLGLAWVFARVSKKGGDRRYSFGYGRFSLLAAVINSLVLINGSLLILSRAVPRIVHPTPTHAPGMLAFAVVGILVNGLAVLRLRSGRSINERVVTWHLLEDVLGWTAVLLASVILLFTGLHILDPILSGVITLYVLFNVLKNLKKTVLIFLQGVPEEVSIELLERRILAVRGVQSVHHTHVWTLDGENHVLSTHVVVEDNARREEIIDVKCDIKALIDELKIDHATVEVEFANESCKMRDRR
jgi:cobalt-zinc-cadmium efflux system protein